MNLRYSHILDEPILKSSLLSHPVLRDLGVIKFANATNFKVTPEQWRAIRELLNQPEGIAGFTRAGNHGLLLHHTFHRAGLFYTPWQVANFFTALQTKGFVILSGISGTGKTKLAQHFPSIMPDVTNSSIFERVGRPSWIYAARQQFDEFDDRPSSKVAIQVHHYMLQHGFFVVPKAAYSFFHPPLAGEDGDLDIYFGDQYERCRLRHRLIKGGPDSILELILRGNLRTWFAERFSVDDLFLVMPEFERDRRVGVRIPFDSEAITLGDPAMDRTPQVSTTEDVDLGTTGFCNNLLFLSVRPDWRDSKSLLGYHNPLTGRYEWMPFLRFLLRAADSHRAKDGLAWFVVLDEMNLAHVEYYFADLLSVLESGRNEDGWTREPLRLALPDDRDDPDAPPRELHLPPNLYLVGTVNVDETTHSFSPKVLDRAFTLDLTEVDFTDYPPSLPMQNGAALSQVQRQTLLAAFTRDGEFARIDKHAIASYVVAHPEARERLQRLNASLRPHGLHFGYRVFDEIVMFLANADRNGLYAEEVDLAPFDAAALMKVLPKFHGSRGKLEAPLRAVLAWSLDPDAPNPSAVDTALRELEAREGSGALLDRLPSPALPRTAERAARMIFALYTDGFASF